MPSVQQFVGLWCSSFTDGLSAVTGCPMSSYTEDNGLAVLAPSFPPPGMQNCGYCDTREVASIAKALLSGVATSTVEKTAGDPFASPVSKAGEVRKELLEYLNKSSDDYSRKVLKPKEDEEGEAVRPSESVDTFIASFIAGKRSLFTQLSTKFALGDRKDDRVGEVYQELEKFGFWSNDRREHLAKVLIQRLDPSGVSHCLESFPLEDEDELSDHQQQCRFAPYSCANPGCGKVNSVLYAAEHDEKCPRKLVPCKLECPVDVPREDMETHCLTVCSMRSVQCPFKSIGCEEPLVQGKLLEHCKEFVEKHLYFTFLAHQQTASKTLDHERRLVANEQAVAMAQQTIDVDVRALTQSLRQAEARIKALETDLKKTHKDVKAANNTAEVAQIRNEVKAIKNSISKPPAAG